MGFARGMHSNNTGLFVAPFDRLVPAQPAPPAPPVAPAAFVSGADFNSTPWSEVADVITISGVGNERSVTQLTHLRSPDKAQEKVPGYLDGGQVTIKLNYYKLLMSFLLSLSPGGRDAFGAPFTPDTSPSWGRRSWAILMPDNGAWVFTGFIKNDPVEVPEDNRNTIEVTIEISGKPTFYAFA